MSSAETKPPRLQVVVVHEVATLHDNLLDCLRAADAVVLETHLIDRCVSEIPAGPAAVVLFPDHFRFEQVVGILFALRRERTDVHVMLVTATPGRFAKLLAASDERFAPSIIEWPVDPTAILETIRAQLRQSSK